MEDLKLILTFLSLKTKDFFKIFSVNFFIFFLFLSMELFFSFKFIKEGNKFEKLIFFSVLMIIGYILVEKIVTKRQISGFKIKFDEFLQEKEKDIVSKEINKKFVYLINIFISFILFVPFFVISWVFTLGMSDKIKTVVISTGLIFFLFIKFSIIDLLTYLILVKIKFNRSSK